MAAPLSSQVVVDRHGSLRHLQRTTGNQSLLKMFEAAGQSRSEGGGRPGRGGMVAVNEPDDVYEREADAVADQVRGMEASTTETVPASGRVQRSLHHKCAQCSGQDEGDQKKLKRVSAQFVHPRCSQCEEGESLQKRVQRTATGAGPSLAPASVHDMLRLSGQPLDPATRGFMEPRFGRDFSSIRIHTGVMADRAVRDVSAAAFTVGSDIAFAQGRYAPQTDLGRRLLAHELVHTIQQGQTPTPVIQRQPDDAAERGRVAALKADYASAIQSKKWSLAALKLNGFNDEDIASRVQKMDHQTRIEVYAGALESMPGFHGRVTKAISEVDAEAQRVGLLLFDFKSAVRDKNWARAVEKLNVFNAADIHRMLSALSSENLAGVRTAAQATYQNIASAAEGVAQERALAEGLEAIRRINRSTTTEDAIVQVQSALAGVNLRKREALEQVIHTIAATFGADSEAVLTVFLTRLEASVPQPQPTPAEVERVERNLSLMQIQPRGPYRQLGPGVLLPVLSQPARHLVPLVEGAQSLFAGAAAFVSGLIEGLSGSLDEEHRKKLAIRLMESNVLNAVFPPVFLAGTLVGVIEDVVDTVKQIYHVVTNFRETIDAFLAFVRIMLSPEATEVGRSMGLETGRSYGGRIAAMVEKNVIGFTYELGRMIGPTILYTVLSFLGVPELAAAAIVERILPILRPLLQRFPILLKVVERLATKLRQRSAETIIGRAVKAGGAREAEGGGAQVVKKVVSAERQGAAKPLENLNEATATMLSKPENQALKNALEANSRAARLLKKCVSPCWPEWANPEQIARLEKIIADAEEIGISVDYDGLREILRNPAVNDAGALDHAIGDVEKAFEKQKALGVHIAEHQQLAGQATYFDETPTAKKLRATPGVAEGGANLAKAGYPWLQQGKVGFFPRQIADRMRGQHFKNFDEFREVFWRMVAGDPELSKGWSPQNLSRMKQGYAPFVRGAEATGGGSNAVWQLDHKLALTNQGEVYNFDNLQIVSPKFHAAVGEK